MMGSDSQSGSIESRDDFEQDPKGQYDYWCTELKASQKSREKWHKQGDQIVNRYLDDRKGTVVKGDSRAADVPFRLNLFHSNITTIKDMMYGNLPTVDVSRTYADSSDDIARVAALAMERLLNNDIAENGEEYDTVLRSTLLDRLLPGLGCARVRYEMEERHIEAVLAIDGVTVVEAARTELVSEAAPCEYFYWGDVLWGWSRNFKGLPWIAYRSFMSKDEVKARGEDWAAIADDLQYKKQSPSTDDKQASAPDQSSVWEKAEIWEVWDKSARKVVYISITGGVDKIIETKDDPLQLKGFFPSPPFLAANLTTSLYQPTPDYQLSQDLYNEIDLLQTRIATITTAVKVVGVYNSAADGVQRMMSEGMDNQLIPVESWALFGENGGIAGAVQWMPLADIVGALSVLTEKRDQTIALLYQITGMSDIMRGDTSQYEGVGQTELKAKMGSVRIQALQDQFGCFASDLLQLKAEVIARHFSPETIVNDANLKYIPDMFNPDGSPSKEGAMQVAQAVQLLKEPEQAKLRVTIKPDSVAMTDFAQLKNERTDYINAVSTFLQSAGPIIQEKPEAEPFLLQMMQWGVAGFKGAGEIEGVLDKAIEESQKAQQQGGNEKPDPEQIKAQAAQQLEQMKGHQKLAEIQASAAAKQAERQQDMEADIATADRAHEQALIERAADMNATIAETNAKMEADLVIEAAQMQSNLKQTESTVAGEIQKDVVETELDIASTAQAGRVKIAEIAASAEADIIKEDAKPKPTTTGGNDG